MEREPLANVGPVSSTIGVWRVGDRVLKHVGLTEERHRYWVASPDESHPLYWRREPLLYASGILETLRGVRAPHAEVVELEDGTYELWLEDLQGLPGAEWDADRHIRGAYDLGAMQGEFAAGRPLPEEAWLSRGWLPLYVEKRRAEMEEALARIHLPSVRRVWDVRGELLAVVDAAPRTFCHYDVWPLNLWDVGGETVLFDWSFAGAGTLGVDIGRYIPDTMLDGFVDHTRIADVDARMFDAYVRGLRDAGWRGDEREVRAATCASAALTFVWTVPRTLTAHEEPIERWLEIWDYLAGLADEALR